MLAVGHWPGLRGAAILVEQAPGPPLPRALGERDDLRLLLVAEEAVECLERRLHGRDRRDHGLDARLHGREPARGGRRRFRRAGGVEVMSGLERGFGEVVERRPFCVVRRNDPLKLIDRQTGDVAAPVIAQSRQAGIACGSAAAALGREPDDRHQQESRDRRDPEEVAHRFLPSLAFPFRTQAIRPRQTVGAGHGAFIG
jgi:hypothetical protein